MNMFDVYPLLDVTPVKAQGCYVFDDQGKQYLDMYGGHAVISIGHSHPHYVLALQQQLKQIGFYSNSVKIPLQQQLADKLAVVSGYEDYNLFLCNSGAEANENALKLASFHNGKTKIIAFKKSFHGRTSLAVSTTDDGSIQAPVNNNEHIHFLPLNDAGAFEKEMSGDVCAVIIEGIQGVGGVNIPDPTFLKLLRALCNKYHATLIIDEVQSGYGRSGRFFAHQHAGILPDMITVAKGMGNGFPVAGVLIHPKFSAKYGLLGTTFGGNYLACTAALAVLEVIEQEKLIQNASAIGHYIIRELKQHNTIKEIRGIGLMIGIELHEPCNRIRSELLQQHQIFTGTSSDKNTLRILPPLTLSKQQADMFLHAMAASLTKQNT